jgi:hypothetical protein
MYVKSNDILRCMFLLGVLKSSFVADEICSERSMDLQRQVWKQGLSLCTINGT